MCLVTAPSNCLESLAAEKKIFTFRAMTRPKGLWRTLLTTPPFPAPNSHMRSKSSSFSSPTWAFWVRKASSRFLCCSSRSSSPSFLCKASRLALRGGGRWINSLTHRGKQYMTGTFNSSPLMVLHRMNVPVNMYCLAIKAEQFNRSNIHLNHSSATYSDAASIVLEVACPSPMGVMLRGTGLLLGAIWITTLTDFIK